MVRERADFRHILLTVDFDEEGLDDIVSDHFEIGMSYPVRDLMTMSANAHPKQLVFTVVREPVKKLSRTVTS